MKTKAQSTIEFTFVIVVIFLLGYGMIRIFRWAGMDLAERRWAHEQTLINAQLSPEQRLSPDFYRPKRVNSVYKKMAQ